MNLAVTIGCIALTLFTNGCTVIGFGVGWAAEPSGKELRGRELEAAQGQPVVIELRREDQDASAEGTLTEVDWGPRTGESESPQWICVMPPNDDFRASWEPAPGKVCLARAEVERVRQPASTSGRWVGLGIGAAADVLLLSVFFALRQSHFGRIK